MSVKVEDLKINDFKIEKTPELDQIVELMSKYGIENGYDFLPKSVKKQVSFTLTNTNSAFANAIRRTLVEDIPTTCMVVDEKGIITDDVFISGMSDVLIKNIALVPIYQTGPLIDTPDLFELYLYVFNHTNDIIDVTARDIKVASRKKSKKGGDDLVEIEELEEPADNSDDTKSSATGQSTSSATGQSTSSATGQSTSSATGQSTSSATDSKTNRNARNSSKANKTNHSDFKDLDEKMVSKIKICPDDNILLARLRPGTYLKIQNIHFETGVSSKHAGKFSLLNNVVYKPIDLEPYNQFTGKGTRSSEKDCRSFSIGFQTCGNIEPEEVMTRLHKKLSDDLSDIYKKIKLYGDSGQADYYSGQDCEITVTNHTMRIKLNGHYLSELNMIAMCGYFLDSNIPYITATVERFDSTVGIIQIKHSDPVGLLLTAIDKCKKEMDVVLSYFQ